VYVPTALIVGPYRISFWSRDCEEPRHVHVTRDALSAKYWLDPVELERNQGFSRRELNDIEHIVNENLDELRRKWDDYCGTA
jgi:hypothetical protein